MKNKKIVKAVTAVAIAGLIPLSLMGNTWVTHEIPQQYPTFAVMPLTYDYYDISGDILEHGYTQYADGSNELGLGYEITLSTNSKELNTYQDVLSFTFVYYDISTLRSVTDLFDITLSHAVIPTHYLTQALTGISSTSWYYASQDQLQLNVDFSLLVNGATTYYNDERTIDLANNVRVPTFVNQDLTAYLTANAFEIDDISYIYVEDMALRFSTNAVLGGQYTGSMDFSPSDIMYDYVAYEDYAHAKNTILETLYGSKPNSNLSPTDLLFAPIESFLKIELFPGFTVETLFIITVAIGVFGVFLKFYAGG